jgi:peptidoglycan/xylan/chitin deacetylase (PgdA/CDA1 family)
MRPDRLAVSAGKTAAVAATVIDRLPTNRRVVALTFDAGAGAQGVAPILAALSHERVPATFFLTGRWVDAQPAAARQIVAAGHLVGDHTVDHPHLPALSGQAVRAEVTSAAATIARVTGRDPHPWFRFPYGESDTRTRAIIAGLGYQAVGWTVDTLGWEGRSAGGPRDVVRRVLARLSPGEIVLMHVGANPDDGTTYDADALPDVITAVRAAGYGFTTVAGDVTAP